jgi:hypothetical protein
VQTILREFDPAEQLRRHPVAVGHPRGKAGRRGLVRGVRPELGTDPPDVSLAQPGIDEWKHRVPAARLVLPGPIVPQVVEVRAQHNSRPGQGRQWRERVEQS